MWANLRSVPSHFSRPVVLLRDYTRRNFQPDLLAGLTVATILLPQAIVLALLAGLPPQMGLYAGIVASIVGALWGSSNHLNTGPTNSASILVLSTLLPIAVPGTEPFILAAGMLAALSGIIRLSMGLVHLGILVNFVSDSVIVGFTAGAGLLIAVGELRYLLRLPAPPSSDLLGAIENLGAHLTEAHLLSLALGLGTIALILALKRYNAKLPGALIAIALSSLVVALFGLDQIGVSVLGELPRSLPPFTPLPLSDMQLVGQLATGALAIAALGLVEATSIARSIASKSGQRLDNNQEFVGQGLANIAAGFLSGLPCSGSFNRSALNYSSGARTPLSNVFCGITVLVTLLVFAPFAAYLPRAALAGILLIAAYGMIDQKEIVRLLRGARGDAAIMLVTLSATLLLPLQFAVLAGILMSFAYYILKTSAPQVHSVVPDENFAHFIPQGKKPVCPQLAIFEILGDLYFGAVNHVEETIYQHQLQHPTQRFVLLRMRGVHFCDISGIHMLENVVRSYRARGGDVYMVRVREPVLRVMKLTRFYNYLGADHFLSPDGAVEYLFYKVLDPAICIYESNVRVFRECQNLPRPDYPIPLLLPAEISPDGLVQIKPRDLWLKLRAPNPPRVVDVREPREFQRGHIPQAELHPLSELVMDAHALPRDRPIVLVCRGGRRSERVAQWFRAKGYKDIAVLQGGMLAWEAADLLEAVECE